MLKSQELSSPDSCWHNALSNERVFVLLARDEAAPAAIRAWVKKRIELGKNHPNDREIVEALTSADLMEHERPGIRSFLGKS